MFKVGVLYACQEVLRLISVRDLPTLASLLDNFPFVFQVTTSMAVELALRCKWITLEPNGGLRMSPRGRNIVTAIDHSAKLRLQIKDLIEFERPYWAALLTHGRTDLRLYADANTL